MIICIATDNIYPKTGGIATFNHHLSKLLSQAGHTVILLVPGDLAEKNLKDEVTYNGNIITVRLNESFINEYQAWTPYFRPGGFDAPYWIALGKAMRNWLQQQQLYSIDVLEVSDYGGLGVFLSDPALPPLLLTGHGSFKQYARYNYTKDDEHARLITMLEDLSFEKADAVIAHSPLDQQDLQQLFNRKIEKALMPFCKPEIAEQKPSGLVITAGGLQPIKGIYQTAEAMEILKQTDPSFRLHWIGNDTYLAPGQQQMSKYLHKKYPTVWKQSLIWENEIPAAETLEAIASAKWVLIPSYFETFNYTALEATALNKAIVITEGAGAHAHFKHGESAWIIPANRPQALAEAIRKMENDTGLQQTLSENAGKIIEGQFSPDKIVHERIQLYLDTIRNRKSTDPVSFSFLEKWQNASRKNWFSFRDKIKKLIGR